MFGSSVHDNIVGFARHRRLSTRILLFLVPSRPELLKQVPLLPAVCFFMTGFSALVCEVCWIRKSSLVFGSSVWAMSVVLAIFFVGLATGSFLVGRASRRSTTPLRSYSILEIGVGVLAILSPGMFYGAELVFSWFYPLVYESLWQLTLIRGLLVSCLILPATILMGGSLPLFCRQFLSDPRSIVGGLGLLYGINTLGAALGAACCGFWMLPLIGINASLIIAGAINITIGLIAWVLFRRVLVDDPERPLPLQIADGKPGGETPNNVLRSEEGQSPFTVEALFFGVGFNAMAAEVLWTRYLSLWLPNTVHTYTLTLSVVLIGIVAGSLFTTLFANWISRKIVWLGWAQVLSSCATMGVMQLRPQWWGGWFNAVSIQEQLMVVMTVLFIPSMLSGICFPLAVSLLVGHSRESGEQAGRMAAINLLGGVLGSLSVGFVGFPLLGLQWSLFALTGLGVLLGLIAWWSRRAALVWPARVLASTVAIGALITIPMYFRTKLPQSFLEVEGTLVDFREGVNANVSVVQKGDLLHLEINRMWQGQNTRNHQPFAAHIPALLHDNPKDVLAIGLGTGQTASSFLVHEIDLLDIAEIEDGLIQLVRKHFDGQWMDDPRVRMIIEDGRNYIAHTANQYDIISIEAGQIYRPGIAAFYSEEFYQSLVPKLHEEGLVCQFVPIEFFQLSEFQTVVATFREVFPECLLWYNTSEMLLIGKVDSKIAIDLSRLQSRKQNNSKLNDDLQYSYWAGANHYLSRLDAWMAGFLCGPNQVKKLSAGGEIYRDDRPFLEYLPLNRETQVLEIIGLIRKNLAPVDELATDRSENWQLAAERIRVENLQEIPARVMFNTAQRLEVGGDLEGAVQAYQESLGFLPVYPKSNWRMAEIMKAQGQSANVLSSYKRILTSDPLNTKALFELSLLHLELGQEQEATSTLRRLLALEPKHPSGHGLLAIILRSSGQYAEAEQHWIESFKVEEPDAKQMAELVSVQLLQGKTEVANQTYLEAQKKFPESIDVPVAAGWASGQLGQNELALRYLEEALRIDPKSVQAKLGMANVKQASGDTKAARQIYEELLKNDPTFRDARMSLALSQQQDGLLTEALGNFRELLKAAPPSPSIHASMAMILAIHPDASIRDTKQALSMAAGAWEATGKKVPEAGESYAVALAAEKRFSEALAVIAESLKLVNSAGNSKTAERLQALKSLYEEAKKMNNLNTPD
jgi:spermidine synthase